MASAFKSSEIKPGLIILHGNQLEMLRSAVFQWLRQNPLAPLEQETYLVQSNGVAEWLKIAVAEDSGICAATKIDLPGRFLWGVYRAMLGRIAMPSSSPLDKSPLTWRLMRLLPELTDQPEFAPLRRFLAGGDPERRLQLAQQVADILDQYQLYRSDWLEDWAEGRDQLRQASGQLVALTEDQLWQAQLWAGDFSRYSRAATQHGAGQYSSAFYAGNCRRCAAAIAFAAACGVVWGFCDAKTNAGSLVCALCTYSGVAGGAKSLSVLLGRHY